MWALHSVSDIIDVTHFLSETDNNDLPDDFFFFWNATFEEKEVKDVEGTELNPHFPQNYEALITGYETICQEQTDVQRSLQSNRKLSYKYAS